jgi:HD-like signal output (HDOD) protein
MNQAREFLTDLAEQISMPAIYLEIRCLIAKPDYQISDFVSLVKADAMLTARLIRIANSQFFGIPDRANNLYQAISLIGVMQLHDIMLSSLCMRTFSAMPEQILNQKLFWQYCTQCGVAARTIAQHCSVIGSNHFFPLGLLHEVGHAVMYLKAPEKCLQVIDESDIQSHSVIELERQKFGFDYTQLGKELMHLWQLPESYQQVVAFHLEPNKADPTFQLEVLIIHLAHIICQNQVTGQNQKRVAKLIEGNHQLALLPADIENIVLEEIATHTEIVLDILWPYRSSFEAGNRMRVNQ